MSVIERLKDGGDALLNKTMLLNASRVGYLLREPTWDPADTWVSMRDKVCVVTGANSGLGRVVSTRLAGLGARVYMLCRNEDKGKQAQREIQDSSRNPDVFLEIADVSRPSSIHDFVQRFTAKEDRLDLLVNNAGGLMTSRETTDDGHERTFATNTLGPFLLTNSLIPALGESESARVINVSSAAMYFAMLNGSDPQFERRTYLGPLAYAESKRALVELTQHWADRLQGSGIVVHAMHPGWSDTPAAWGAVPSLAAPIRPLLRTPEQGADTLLWLAVNPNLTEQESGHFWFDRRPRATHRFGFGRSSEAERASYWDLCCRLAGCTPGTAAMH